MSKGASMAGLIVAVTWMGSAGCGGETEAPLEIVVERKILRVPGAQPEGTPDEYNASRALIFHDINGSDVNAVILLMPGFLAGGNAARPLAEQLVSRGGIEVWAIDRRANLLEDLSGVAASDAAGTAAYYRDGGTVDGHTFEGFRKQADLEFMKEWGLAVHAEDLRAVVDEARAQHPDAALYLAGHSLGAMFAEVYAGHEFDDGGTGADDLKGLIFLDGVLGATPTTDAVYAEAIDGLKPFTGIPFLGVSIYTTLLIAGRRALEDPDGIVVDSVRDNALGLMMSVADMPKMTNRAAVGFALDDEFSASPALDTSLGQVTGGPTESYKALLDGRDRLRPSDKDATYGWIDSLDADPPELSPVDNLLSATVDSEADFAEWYFPSRLPTDLSHTAPVEITLPVLSIPAGLFLDSMAVVADRMAEGVSFKEVDAKHMAHVDVLVAADIAANPVPDAIAAFVR